MKGIWCLHQKAGPGLHSTALQLGSCDQEAAENDANITTVPKLRDARTESAVAQTPSAEHLCWLSTATKGKRTLPSRFYAVHPAGGT